jgi:hypothetical protein
MDLQKMDARWERAQALWEKIKNGWHTLKGWYHKFLVALAPVILIAFVVTIPFLAWDMFRHPATRHAVGQSVGNSLKWYLIFGIAGWVISKIWRKKPKPESPENDSGDQPSIQASKPKSRRKNNRRVQRRR